MIGELHHSTILQQAHYKMAPFLDPASSSEDTLLLTVRFTTSFDLHLSIPSPSNTTVVALKHLVRTQLSPPDSLHRFRFIHSGKLLKDDDILSSVLRIPSPPPRATEPSGKGKENEPPPPRVYINCSIGDLLSKEELEAEALAAAASNKRPTSRASSVGDGGSPQPKSTTTLAQRGFDRLLSGGFTVAEVNQLRLQFRSIQSNIHTPETMPSSETLLRMEDAWIDDNAGNTGAVGASGFDFGDDGLGGGALDDLLWGNIMGFLWPLGCIGWMIREGGVWSRRRQIAVVSGFLLSFSFGMLRVLS